MIEFLLLPIQKSTTVIKLALLSLCEYYSWTLVECQPAFSCYSLWYRVAMLLPSELNANIMLLLY